MIIKFDLFPDFFIDIKFKIFFELTIKLLGGKRICAVTISDKFEIFRKLGDVFESHTHRKNACTNVALRRYAVSKKGNDWQHP